MPEKLNKRRKKGVDTQERYSKRRKLDTASSSIPAIEGAAAQVRGWSYGNLPKRDATRFFRAVSGISLLNSVTFIHQVGLSFLLRDHALIRIMVFFCSSSVTFRVCVLSDSYKLLFHIIRYKYVISKVNSIFHIFVSVRRSHSLVERIRKFWWLHLKL